MKRTSLPLQRREVIVLTGSVALEWAFIRGSATDTVVVSTIAL